MYRKQAIKAGAGTGGLNGADLVLTKAGHHDVKFGLLFSSGGVTTRSRASGHSNRSSGGPVSHTYLRAHETALEIVCLLLPEKKIV